MSVYYGPKIMHPADYIYSHPYKGADIHLKHRLKRRDGAVFAFYTLKCGIIFKGKGTVLSSVLPLGYKYIQFV